MVLARPRLCTEPRHHFPLRVVEHLGKRRRVGARETSLNEGTSGCEGQAPAFLPSSPPRGWARLGAPVTGAMPAPRALPAAADRGGATGGAGVPGRAAEAPGSDPLSACLSPAASPRRQFISVSPLLKHFYQNWRSHRAEPWWPQS